LSQYSGTISVAESQAEMKQVFADMREANALGRKYAEMILKEQEINQRFQEALQPLKEKLMEVLPALADSAASMLPLVLGIAEGIGRLIELQGGAFFKVISDMVDKAKKLMEKAAARERAPEEEDMGAFDGVRRMMEQLQIPNAGQNPAGQFARNNNLPFFLNPPRN
jgi:hypothetical protein